VCVDSVTVGLDILLHRSVMAGTQWEVGEKLEGQLILSNFLSPPVLITDDSSSLRLSLLAHSLGFRHHKSSDRR